MLSKGAIYPVGRCHRCYHQIASVACSNVVTRSSVTAWKPHTQRRHATTSTDDKYDESSSRREASHAHIWPKAPKGCVNPTPYQIFAMDTKGVYSKARYYELVKLYHPDLVSTTGDELSHGDRMERYRLIVAAHGILSDPTKRKAYDRFGAGWNGRSESIGGKSRHQSTYGSPGPFSSSYTSKEDPIWQNATWEDWERFYQKQARDRNPDDPSAGHSVPVYMRNSYFVILVSVLAAIGGSLNYNRAQDAGTYFVEQRDMVHDRAAKELRKVRQEMSGLSNREERIQFFLRQREAAMGGMTETEMQALRDERAKRVLPDAEVCQSSEVQKDDKG